MAAVPSLAQIQEQLLHVDDDATPNIIAVNVVCFTIACVSVALRFLARRVAGIKYAADDWLILVGLVRHKLISPPSSVSVQVFDFSADSCRLNSSSRPGL